MSRAKKKTIFELNFIKQQNKKHFEIIYKLIRPRRLRRIRPSACTSCKCSGFLGFDMSVISFFSSPMSANAMIKRESFEDISSYVCHNGTKKLFDRFSFLGIQPDSNWSSLAPT